MQRDAQRKPGIYPNLSHWDYHDAPAFSASMAWSMWTRCARYAWWYSTFNPNYEPVHKREYDIGTAVHLACLEPDKMQSQIVVIDGFADFKKQEAQALRDAAYAQGKVPILRHKLAEIYAIRAAVLEDPEASKLLRRAQGSCEVSAFYNDPDTGIPCKLRADHVLNAGNDMVDIKSTSNANPAWFKRQIPQQGYHLRAAWYLHGWEIAAEKRPKRYSFLCVEVKPPYLVSVIECEERALEAGELIRMECAARFADMLNKGDCPGYVDPRTGRPTVHKVGLPGWYEFELSDRMEGGDFSRIAEKPSIDMLRRGVEMQRPLDGPPPEDGDFEF